MYILKRGTKTFLGHSTLPTINFALWDVQGERRKIVVVCVLPSTRELVQYRIRKKRTIQASGDKPYV